MYKRIAGVVRTLTVLQNNGQRNGLRHAAALCMTAALLGGCSAGHGANAFAELQQVNCPTTPPVVSIDVDQSATGRSPELKAQRLDIVKHLLEETAACDGHARVTLFSAAASASVVLLDNDLRLAGATRNSRLRKVPALIQQAMRDIDASWDEATSQLPGEGSDPLARLSIAAEYRQQFGTKRPLKVFLIGDGISTTGVVLNTKDLTRGSALELARRIAVPAFDPLVTLTFIGVGRVAGTDPPTSYIDSLKQFYAAACARTGATCGPIVTDYSLTYGSW